MRAILAHEFWKVKRHIFLATNHRKESATFSVKSYTHGVEGERAPLHRALHPVPAPAQRDHAGQDSAGQTAFGVDEAARQHAHQDDTNAEGRARRQGLDQTMHGCRRKGYWVGARIWRDWVECFHHRPSIPNPSTESYSNGKTGVLAEPGVKWP
jgi:hypothetical protein